MLNNSKYKILASALSVAKSLPTGNVSVSDVLNHRAGVFTTIVHMRYGKVRKAFQGQVDIRKAVIYKNARIGVNYENKADVIEGRANGSMPSVNTGRKWGEWMEGSDGKLIINKGTYHIAIDGFGAKVESIWYMDGKEVTKEAVAPYLLSSETKEKEKVESFRNEPKLENIVYMG
tara:strand:+ start:952 stop:1476 length:525 start_codon:yes stop_codon:yes gene_type:complete